MSLLLETIRIDQGKPENIEAHEERISRSQIALEGHRLLCPLKEIFEETPPPVSELYKARIEYDNDLYQIDYQKYSKANISSLHVYRDNSIYYPYKFANRYQLNRIKKICPEHAEVLIVVGDRITDSTFTNLAFWNGEKWLTPKYPLLPGTRRANLIDQGIIELNDIKINQLMDFEKVKLFNAMMSWDDAIEILISQVIR